MAWLSLVRLEWLGFGMARILRYVVIWSGPLRCVGAGYGRDYELWCDWLCHVEASCGETYEVSLEWAGLGMMRSVVD